MSGSRPVALIAVLVVAAHAAAAAEIILEVDAGGSDRIDTPVWTVIPDPGIPPADAVVQIKGPNGVVPGQVLKDPDLNLLVLFWSVSIQLAPSAMWLGIVNCTWTSTVCWSFSGSTPRA